MWHDLKHALRALRRRVSVTFLAVLVLGLGLGAALVVVSVVEVVLLRPLPFEEPERLVAVWEKNPTKGWYENVVAPANFFDWRASTESFEDMAIYGSWIPDRIFELDDARPRRVTALDLGPRFFEVLGVPLTLGQEFDDDDLWNRTEPAVVLSHGLWTRAFAADPGVLGRQITVEGRRWRVRGVAPSGFAFPEPVDVYLPFSWDAEARDATWFRRAHFVRAVGRLAPGSTIDEARSELAAVAARLEREFPQTNTDMGTGVTALHEWVVGDTREPLRLVATAVGLLLLVSCANVASLMLLRAGGRRREIAVRSALGAGRPRLVRLLALEGVLLAAAASAVGYGFAHLCLRLLEHVSLELPRLQDVALAQAALEPRVLLATLAIALVACLGFSLVPALVGSQVDLRGALHASAGRHSESRGSVRARRVLVVAEVALAVLLVVGSGLFVRSLWSLYQVDPGFDAEGVLTVRLNVPGARYEEPDQVQALYDRIVVGALGLPGVEAVGQSRTLPLGGGTWTSDYSLLGAADHGVETQHLEIDEGYAEAVGLRVLAGRAFEASDRDDAEPVALVSRELVRDILPFADHPREILGRRICSDRECTEERSKRVVGVVDDIRFEGLAYDVRPIIYHSLRQRPQLDRDLFVRAETADAAALRALAGPIEAIVQEADAGLPLMRVRTLEEVIDRSLARERFLTALLAAFGSLALVLALVGTYGVLATAVQLRRRELGIRAALGAARRDLEGWVLRQGLGLVGLGAAVGLGLALLVARSVESQLFAVGGRDPATYAAAAGLLLLTGALAAWLPARRAARVDPAEVLRSE